MVWFTCTSVILLITLTIMLLVLPVALPPLPPPPPVLMLIPVVILVLLLVLAVLPAGFNGVVVGYLWRRILVCSLSFTFLLQNYLVNLVWKLWQNCTEVSFCCFLHLLDWIYLPHTHAHTHITPNEMWVVVNSRRKYLVLTYHLIRDCGTRKHLISWDNLTIRCQQCALDDGSLNDSNICRWGLDKCGSA